MSSNTLKPTNSEERFKLDFVGIGAPRSGTTWIAQCLSEHPDICSSSKKELGFFLYDKVFGRGITHLQGFFSHCVTKRKKGEWTVDYLYSRKAAERIKEHNSDIKILVCLRSPVDRAYSHYLLKKYSASIMPLYGAQYALSGQDKYGYIKMGKYSEYLATYLALFPQEHVLILIYEECVANPEKWIRRIYEFLGVDPSFVPLSLNANIDYRASGKFYSLYLQSMLNKSRGYIKKSALKKFFDAIGLRSLVRTLIRANRRKTRVSFTKPSMSPFLRQRLETLYAPEIQALENMLGKKLPWRDKTTRTLNA